MTTTIVEVVKRSTQGVTQPFICRSDDGDLYFVKGIGAGRRSQICELLCARLAQSLELPIPPYAIVDVPIELIELGAQPDLTQLGSGPAFGSLLLQVTELTAAQVPRISPGLQRDVLAFDWWIRNADRTLTDLGGNPNLFWNTSEGGLVVLDHNLAFDPKFDTHEFVQLHAFRAQWQYLSREARSREEYARRFTAALSEWDEICATIPQDWWTTYPNSGLPTDFDLGLALATLEGFLRDDFWTSP